MNHTKRCCLGLLVLGFALHLRAEPQPILIAPPARPFGGSSLSNLRLRNQSADGDEVILTVDFAYDGTRGPTARLLPFITDKKQGKISGWFGADPVSISTGQGTISLRVKFFNDDLGVPPELTTDHVKILMLTDGGNAVISQGQFAKTIKWGSPNARPAKVASAPAPAETPNQAQAQADEALRREAAAKQLADQQAEAKRLADEKLRQEAEAKQLADQQAEAKRLADEKLRQEAEAKQLADQQAEAKRLADEKLRQEAAAKQLADQQAEARRLADEKLQQEAAAKQLAEANAKAAVPAPAKATFALSPNAKTKVINVDVVNRNIDRTEMTLSVECKYAKEDAMPKMGIDVASSEEPAASAFFSSPLADLSHGSRGVLTFPVKLDVAAARSLKRATLPTDKVWIYLADANGAKTYIYQSIMILVWHIPGGAAASPVVAPASAPARVPAPAPALSVRGGNTIAIGAFKQDDPSSGYVNVDYNLAAGSSATLRLRIYDSAKPASADWFFAGDIAVTPGSGRQLIRVGVPKEAASPGAFNTDTIEVQMLDKDGAVTADVKQPTSMNWAKPR